MDQILNELSVSSSYPDKFAARAGMNTVIDVSLSLANLGMSKTIRTVRDFKMRYLADGYSVADWTWDKNANKEKKTYFLTHATKSPYIENFYEAQEQDNELFEFRLGQEVALGLGLSSLWGTSSISLDGDPRFLKGQVIISEYRMTGEKENNQDIPVFTFSKMDQVGLQKDSIQESLCCAINSGQDMLRDAKEMLPFLSFCSNAIDQINKFCGSEQFFPEVLNHLFTLNTTMREWNSGPYSPNLDFSVESESTMKNTTFAQKRTFLCSDNIERQFRLHSKIKSANKRIYFLPIPEQKIVHIGCIGDHLPTTKFSK